MEIQSVAGLGGHVFGSWESYHSQFDGGDGARNWRHGGEVKYYMCRAKIPEPGGLIVETKLTKPGLLYCLGSTSFVWLFFFAAL